MGQRLRSIADLIFINTGERPAAPKIPGIETVDAERVLDSTSIQELGELPGHLLVIGGGYVGLEFGQLFRRFGSEVTIIQRGKQLLPREDADVAECMLKILQEDGLTVHLNTSTTHVAQIQNHRPNSPLQRWHRADHLRHAPPHGSRPRPQL